jgi:hypothetical protein
MLIERPIRDGNVRINHNIRVGDEENRRQWTLPSASARPRYPPARIMLTLSSRNLVQHSGIQGPGPSLRCKDVVT